ncbi:MAG: phosphomethylpyrimidine synthase ThiC [Acidobacteriota bacterium]
MTPRTMRRSRSLRLPRRAGRAARDAGVQVMVEGLGHVPPAPDRAQHEARASATTRRSMLGPLVTDAFPGYDHITRPSAQPERPCHGAAMLCYVTPGEHVGLPKAEDVKAGCIAYKIAAHAGDVAKGLAETREWDDDLSRARAALNWPRQFELAFDGATARALHDEDLDVDTDFCAMCGHDWCSMRISKEISEFESGKDDAFQPAAKAQPSPGVDAEGESFLRRRVTTLPVVDGRHACHSDRAAGEEEAREIQLTGDTRRR